MQNNTVTTLLLQVILFLAVFLATAAARILSLKREFPGQRVRGVTNYGTHAFGANGWVGRPMSSKYAFILVSLTAT